jgi:glycosyltransferase involved in cell wall biosynthesis
MEPARTPLTTVVIPAWDEYAGERLAEALASVEEQVGPKRVVVVDNASTAPLAVAAHAEVIRTPQRLTLGAARNFGLQRVLTPYVLFWDADDTMLPDTLERLEAAIAADPGLAAFGAAIIEHPTGERHRWPRTWIPRLTRFPRLFALVHSVWSMYPTTGATIMRTELVRAAGGYADTDSGQDWVLGVSLAFRGRMGWSERPGRVYRIHPQSVFARHIGSRHLVRHARVVRERLRVDPDVPGWVRPALPLIQLSQYLAIGLHLALGRSRRLRRSRERSGGDELR